VGDAHSHGSIAVTDGELDAAASEESPRPTTTADVESDPKTSSASVWLRRAFMTILAVIVVLGLLDILGVHSRTVAAQSGDGTVSLHVHYAQVARAGLDVPFEITVQRKGGFVGDVVLAISSAYFDLFDMNAINPEPSSATATDSDSIWTFDRPPGDTLQVSVDMQVQGGRHWGKSGTVAVLDSTGKPTAAVHFKTWLAP
jgi:hypothetical protein